MAKDTAADSNQLSAQEHAATFSDKFKKIALVIVCLGFVMDLLDSTIVNIAIPSIQTNLHATYSDIQWILAGYTLTFAVLLITGGRMGDVFGYKKLFMIGMGGFTIASLLSGSAPNVQILIFARLLQGAMAALMVPQVISIMQIMYKPEERAGINGLFGMLGGAAASLGPVIGGLLIKANFFNLDWRPIFLINVPVGIFGLFTAFKYLPNGKSPHPLKLDITGTILIMITLVLLVFPLIEGRELNWPAWSFVMMAASIPLLFIFIYQQKARDKKDGSPLVLPSLFKNHSFGIGMGVNLIFEMVMIGFFLTFGLFLQIGIGYSPLHAALTGVPLAIGIAVTMATLGEKFIPKLGRVAMNIGVVVMGSGLIATSYVFYHYTYHTHSWQLIPGLLCFGIGMGFVFGSLFAAVLNGVDAKQAGSASGLLNAVQQVGGAIGIAVIGVIFFGLLNHQASNSFNKTAPAFQSQLSSINIPAGDQSQIINGTEQCFVDRSQEKDTTVTPASCKTVQQTSSSNKQVAAIATENVAKANSTNFANAFRWATVYEIIVLAVTFGLTFFLPRHFKAAPSEAV
jgi:EmrB/QacA subfamily drug resistance transporter